MPETGDLYLSFPIEHTVGTARKALQQAGIATLPVGAMVVMAPLAPGAAERAAAALAQALSAPERLDARALLIAPGEAPGGEAWARARALDTWLGRIESAWVLDTLRQGRLASVFQPIVSSADPTAVFAHEVLLRASRGDGTAVAPSDLFHAAAAGGLLFHLDRAARVQAIRAASEAGVFDAGLAFINFVPSSIYDPAFCLRTTEAAVARAGVSPANVVFEVVESEHGDPDHLRRILRHYRANGFRIALDDLGAGYSSLNLMATLQPDFVKLDMALVQGVALDPYRARMLDALLGMARGLGVETVAEGVETAADFAWVRDHGATYVQGFAVARPGNPPPVPRRPV